MSMVFIGANKLAVEAHKLLGILIEGSVGLNASVLPSFRYFCFVSRLALKTSQMTVLITFLL